MSGRRLSYLPQLSVSNMSEGSSCHPARFWGDLIDVLIDTWWDHFEPLSKTAVSNKDYRNHHSVAWESMRDLATLGGQGSCHSFGAILPPQA